MNRRPRVRLSASLVFALLVAGSGLAGVGRSADAESLAPAGAREPAGRSLMDEASVDADAWPPPVGAPGRQFEDDPRSLPPRPPADLRELERRFLPHHRALAEPTALALRQGENAEYRQRVTEGLCYAAVAFGPTLRHIELDVFLGDRRIGQDLRRDPWPIATFCAPASGEIRIVVHATRGHGPVYSRLLVEPSSRRLGLGDGGSPVVNRLLAAQRRVHPRSRAVSDLGILAFDAPGIQTVTVPLPASGCYAAVVAGDPGPLSLAIRVRHEGSVLAEDRDPSASGSAIFCLQEGGEVHVDVASLLRGARVGLQVIAPM